MKSNYNQKFRNLEEEIQEIQNENERSIKEKHFFYQEKLKRKKLELLERSKILSSKENENNQLKYLSEKTTNQITGLNSNIEQMEYDY
jgi:antitoxin component YwqK of YwqJK toxin-antitoxin module